MSNIEVIRSHLDQAVIDIDYFLSCEKKWENGKRELVEFYNSMEAKNAASEKSVIKEKLSELTPEQDAALGWRTVDGETISDEQRNKVLADIAPSQPMSDEEWEGLQDNLRGGWRKSSDKAAEWLQKAGETVAADAIREELSQLPDAQMLASETDLPSYREPIRKAARQVGVILSNFTSFKGLESHFIDNKTESFDVPPEKHVRRLLESRVLKEQYESNSVDSKIFKRAKTWFGRDWNKKFKADGKAWQERFCDHEQQELISLRSFFDSKWKS